MGNQHRFKFERICQHHQTCSRTHSCLFYAMSKAMQSGEETMNPGSTGDIIKAKHFEHKTKTELSSIFFVGGMNHDAPTTIHPAFFKNSKSSKFTNNINNLHFLDHAPSLLYCQTFVSPLSPPGIS